MDSTREERMQQRLRGAQRRQVKDVDFQLAFPVAQALEEPVEPNQSPPQAELPSLLSDRHTPATRSQDPPANDLPLQGTRQPRMKSGNIDANTSAKRRKLDIDDAPSSGRSTRSSRAIPRPDIYALPEEDPQDVQVPETSNIRQREENRTPPVRTPEPEPVLSVRRLRGSTTPSQPPRTQEEITESPENAPGSGHRAIIFGSVVRTSSQLHIVQNSSSPKPAAVTPLARRKRNRGEISQSPLAEDIEQESSSQAKSTNPIEDEIDELSPDQPIKWSRKRKAAGREEPSIDKYDEPIMFVSPDKRTAKRSHKTKMVAEKEPSVVEQEEPSGISGTQEGAEAIDDMQAAALLKKNQGRRISRNFQAETSPDLDEPEIAHRAKAKTRRGKSRKESSPVIQRQPKLPSKITATKSKKPVKKAKLRSGSPIPVTVHRFTKQLLFDENEPDADILNMEMPQVKRAGVNAVDVLSQVCGEIIGAGLETLEEGGNNAEDPSLKREYKTKWRALYEFKKELQTRLLTYTINLDNVYSLEKRVREEQKRKLRLRDEILRVRAERQQLALKMDEIRMKHENESKKAQEREILNATAHDIELAVDRGKTMQSRELANGSNELTGVELLLKRMANAVSTKSDSGGILQQIKEFNGFLERAALALESKKV
ncbi:hypothetical protein G7Y89_g4463 [Cudoniella acicularis]|uniref:Inner kinetochore subunit AME1 domain-containing protein n=1 Tax=Cudoniella acicularis TaxID=354080 RepID=A0A8H4RRJ7_9HELO|nr:hypothetical protein G7Y89_g4463 [Cudoniella acicularis]